MTQGSLMQHPLQFAQIGQQITQILLSNSNPDLLLANVAKVLGEFFGVDFCLLVTVNQPTSKTNSALWSADDCPPLPLAQQLQLLEYKAGNNYADQPIAVCEMDFGVWDQEGRQWDVPKTGAMLRISTQYQSLINGFIVLGQLQPYEWTTLEKDLLKMISESVAIAISKVQQSIQIQAATRHQTLLNQLSQALPSALDLDEILQIATASTAQALLVDRGLLLLLKYSNPLFKQQPSTHPPKTEMTVACEWFAQSPQVSVPGQNCPTSLLNQNFWLSESELFQQAYRNAPDAIAIANRLAPPPHLAAESLLERELMPAVLIVPLVGAYSHARPSSIIGFLVFGHHQARLWNAEELELVKWVSVQVSATIIQNQTLRQVQSLVEERTAQLQSSLEIQAKLYEKTRQQMNQLQQLNLLKDEFLSSMSHELRTPLTTMSLAIRMLRHPQITQERRDKYLEILEQECNKEIDLIIDLLSLQRLESNQSQLQPQNIDLMLLLKDLIESFEQKWASKRLTLTIESPANSLYLHTDPDSLNRILLELLTNAGKYSHPDTTISLQITHQVQPSNQLVITISNTGSGISKNDLTQIFEKFHRGQGVTKKAVQGTGLGLAFVKCLVQNLNGTIEVTSTPIASDASNYLTTFTLTLPQLQTSAE
ncbi:MAG: ATP-binding protein [Coleofasciculaceae cyanobacterium]